MKWAIVQLVESAEAPRLTEGQVGLCCPMAELRGKGGNELLNLIEADAYAIGKQVQQLLFTQQIQALDAELSAQRIHEEDAECQVVFDGQDPLAFVTRFGVIRIPLQQAHCNSHGADFTPLNRLLPARPGQGTRRMHHHAECARVELSVCGLEPFL